MKEYENKQTDIWFMLLTCVVLLLTVALSIGVSFARFRTRETSPSAMAYGFGTNGIHLLGAVNSDGVWGLRTDDQSYVELSPDDFAKTEDGCVLDFAITNFDTDGIAFDYGQNGSVSAFITSGAVNDSSYTISLETNQGTYQAVWQAVAEGTETYRRFGDGWILTFLDRNGKEPDLVFSGGNPTAYFMRFRVRGSSVFPAAVTLTAKGVPVADA